MRDLNTRPCAFVQIVNAKVIHVAPVEVQAHGDVAIGGHAGDVNMIGVRHKGTNRTRREQEHAAANEFDSFIAVTRRIETNVAALVQHAAHHAYHAPAAVIVDRRPLAG